MTEKQTPSTTPASKRQKAIAFLWALLAIGMMGAWQYSKYKNGHGFFRLFQHGDVILAACIVAAIAFITVLALRDK
jgi:hypothetical protein